MVSYGIWICHIQQTGRHGADRLCFMGARLSWISVVTLRGFGERRGRDVVGSKRRGKNELSPSLIGIVWWFYWFYVLGHIHTSTQTQTCIYSLGRDWFVRFTSPLKYCNLVKISFGTPPSGTTTAPFTPCFFLYISSNAFRLTQLSAKSRTERHRVASMSGDVGESRFCQNS